MREILDKVDELIVQLRRIAYALEFKLGVNVANATPCVVCGSLMVDPGKECPACLTGARQKK